MRLDPDGLYELVDEVPDLGRPVLVQVVTGFVDAGSGTRLAREHLLARPDAKLLVRFAVDQLVDYRARRPMMTFAENHWEDYAEPVLGIHLLHDDGGTPFLVLAGPEPDAQWERFIDAVAALIERLQVRLTVGLTAIPMAVPHTRPLGVTAHATRQELIAGYEPWLARAQVPATVGNLLEFRLGQRGRDALGFAVHVPHYLAQATFPAAAEELLTQVSRATGLMLPTGELRAAAGVVLSEIDKQVAEAEEVGALVRKLEQQYDAYTRDRHGPFPTDGPLPTADELGAEFERFLAERNPPSEPPAS